jgi:hypothetical protein
VTSVGGITLGVGANNNYGGRGSVPDQEPDGHEPQPRGWLSVGSTQATYNGHPLYTYTADTAPGQANGNGINASGGYGTRSPYPGQPHLPPAPSSGGGCGY